MSNQFVFTCPIFNVDTKFAACTELRHRVWRGEQLTVRKGCQACMASNKCPVAREVSASIYNAVSLVEHYVSADEPKKGKLRAQVLRDIRPVVVQQQHLDKYAVPPAERDLIMTANPRIDAMIGSAPEKDLKPYVDRSSRKREPAQRPAFVSRPTKAETKPIETAIDKAAASGDLAAAINNAA